MRFNKWFFVGIFTLFYTVVSIVIGPNLSKFDLEFRALYSMFSLVSLLLILIFFRKLTSIPGKYKLFADISFVIYVFLLLLGSSLEVLRAVYEMPSDLSNQLLLIMQYTEILSLIFLSIFFLLYSFTKRLSLKLFSLGFLISNILLILIDFAGVFKLHYQVRGILVGGDMFNIVPPLMLLYVVVYIFNLLFLGILFIRQSVSIKQNKA